MFAALIAPIFRASGTARNSRSFSSGRHRVQGLPQGAVPDLTDEELTALLLLYVRKKIKPDLYRKSSTQNQNNPTPKVRRISLKKPASETSTLESSTRHLQKADPTKPQFTDAAAECRTFRQFNQRTSSLAEQTSHKGERFLGLLTAGESADAQLEYQRLKLLTADLIQFNH